MAEQSTGKENTKNHGEKGSSIVSPAFSSPHKAILEINLKYCTELDPNSEDVKTFLKGVGDIARKKGEER